MSTDTPECVRCRAFETEVLLLRGEIAGLRQALMAVGARPVNSESALEIDGMYEAERLAITRPCASRDPDLYNVSLTYRNQLSVQCMIPIADPTEFLRFFEDLAAHTSGWEGAKKVATVEDQFTITCSYEGKRYRPQVTMDVFCALDIPSFDPYWTVQLRLDVDPDILKQIAERAKIFFVAKPSGANEGSRPS